MNLIDKYELIENHLINDKNIFNNIENYIENYLNSELKILAPEYLNQSLYLNNINKLDLINNIKYFIKNYLIIIRNNFRIFVKKETFELTNLIEFLKKFILKIEYINNLIKLDTNLLNESYKLLNNLIISDSIIYIFIEKQVINFNKNIKEFLFLIKKLDLLYNNDMYIKMIKLFGNIYKKNIINTEELPIPINYKLIQKLYNTIKYSNIIYNNYKFIKENIIELEIPIFELILEDLIKIIKFNSLIEIEYTLYNTWYYIINIKKYDFEEKNNLIMNICDEIIYKCSNDINNIDELKIIIKFDKYLRNLYLLNPIKINKYNIFINKIIKLIKILLNDEEYIIFINNYINELVINNNVDIAITLLNIFNNYTINIDQFINTYYYLLIKRLTNNYNLKNENNFLNYINAELTLLKILAEQFNINKFIYKLKKVVYDTNKSYFENNEFIKLSSKLLNNELNSLSVLTTSYDNWNINICDCVINSSILDTIKETQLGKYLKYYELYYTQKNNNIILNWIPSFGEIIIIYLDQELKMLPIQFMIVEMFTNVDSIPLNDIINSKILSNYSEKIKTDIINSIIISNLFIIENDNIIISKSNDIKNNLIEIFLNTSEYINIWEKQKENELAYSRFEIINTVINHTVKIIPKNKNELFELIKDKIKVFKLNNELFNKSIDYLITMDYIILNDKNEYQKLF